MKKRPGFLSLAWVLLGLLAIASAMLFLGSRDRQTQPSANSFAPSGAHAFSELLRQSGYKVVINSFSRPDLRSNDVVLGFLIDRGYDWSQPEEEVKDPTSLAVRKHLMEGGRGLFLVVPADFSQATAQSKAGSHRLVFDPAVFPKAPKGLQITAGASLGDTTGYDLIEATDPQLAAVANQDESLILEFSRTGRGRAAILHDGTGATNRFVAQEQNAEFLLWAVRAVAPPGSRIVFIEAFHSEGVDPGLLRTLGPWAFAGWWQFVLLVLVVAYSLGKRFGLPEVFRTGQRGSRELVNAYADTMRRARKPQVALEKIAVEVDRQVRRRFNIAADLPPKRRNELLPPELASAMTQAEIAASEKPGEVAATRVLFELEDEVAKLSGAPLRRRRKRR